LNALNEGQSPEAVLSATTSFLYPEESSAAKKILGFTYSPEMPKAIELKLDHCES
jgi:hypothetical protein